MSDIFTPIVLSVCVGASAQYNEACRKSTESLYIQSGVSAESKKLQSASRSKAKDHEKQVFGEYTWAANAVGAVGMAAYKKRATAQLPTFGPFETITLSADKTQGTLNFGFRW